MARRAPSSSVPASLMRRSRSFDIRACRWRRCAPSGWRSWRCAAAGEQSFRLLPDQSRARSPRSASLRLQGKQLAEDGRPAGHGDGEQQQHHQLHDQLAPSTRLSMDMSWEFMIGKLRKTESGDARRAHAGHRPSLCGMLALAQQPGLGLAWFVLSGRPVVRHCHGCTATVLGAWP